MQLYTVKGCLNKGFSGYISYGVVLPAALKTLRVKLQHDKREVQDTAAFGAECLAALQENAAFASLPPAAGERLASLAKTEINISVMLDDVWVGGMHKDLTEKEFTLSAENATEGFLPLKTTGVMQVILHVLRVLNDNTNYSLTVDGEIE